MLAEHTHHLLMLREGCAVTTSKGKKTNGEWARRLCRNVCNPQTWETVYTVFKQTLYVLTEVEVVESCSSWRGQGRKAQSATREERRGTVRDRRKWKVRVGCRVLGALGDENGGQKSTETSR
jgi:hypothetical protein